jgi:DNA-binding beta-propeller fold protein YncE
MTGRTQWLWLALIASLAAIGCGSNNSATVTVTITPGSATILVNTSAQFVATVSGSSNTVDWSVNSIAGGNATFGTIDPTGFYIAPAVLPGSNMVTITASVENTSATSTAAVTLDSGIRVSVSPSSATVGTNENFTFQWIVSGTSNQAVSWSVTSGVGNIDPASGSYIAPDTTGTATVTATSAADTSQTASATITIITATDPTISSISPTTGVMGALFQDIYVAGSNFISTTSIFLNGVLVNPSAVASSGSGTTLRVRVPDSTLAAFPTPPATTTQLTFTAARQGGPQQPCPNPVQCTLTLSPVRPALVGTSPDSISQPSGNSPVQFLVNGGFFGTFQTPVVATQFGAVPKLPTLNPNQDRQLQVPFSASDLTGPGLYPFRVNSNISGATVPPAIVNLAIQPSYAGGSSVIGSASGVVAGVQPASVAVDTSTGIAIVANQGSNDITLIDLTQSPPSTLGFICTGTVGGLLTPGETGTCPASGPVSVAVDSVRHVALVANSIAGGISVVDLTARTVTAVLPPVTANAAFAFPGSVGINPSTGLAIVAYQSVGAPLGAPGSSPGAGFATILDMTQSPPAVIGVVQGSNGPSPHVAVSPKLNWALITPGGKGVLTIVDLARQSTNPISGIACSSGTATATTTSLLGLRAGQPVLITGNSNSAFNGIFSVVGVSNNVFTFSQNCTSSSGGGGSASYALPVATVAANLTVRGVAIDDETQKAILLDPAGTGYIFNLLDQSSNVIASFSHGAAGAFNPLTNIAVAVDQTGSFASVVDPTTPAVLTTFPLSGSNSPPVDVAIDPTTNVAVIVDQTVSVVPLGGIRSGPQLLQAGVQSSQPGFSAFGPGIIMPSSLSSPAAAQAQTLTLIGKFTSAGVPRLDGDPALIQKVGPPLPSGCTTNCRAMMATISATVLQNGGPRRYALDVSDSGAVSNALSLAVVQSVNIAGGACTTSAPQAVAIANIDALHSFALVTDPGCNNLAVINISAAAGAVGSGFTIGVGSNPQGVAVYPQAGLAVVANAGSNSASIVDVVNNAVVATVATDPIPTGVAIDPSTGTLVVSATGANVVDTFGVSASGGTATPVAVRQAPSAVAIDPTRHLAAVANQVDNTVSIVDLTQNVATITSAAITAPLGVTFDPVSADFLVTSSTSNQVEILDPNTGILTAIRVGINPTSLAYNAQTSTLVTTNSLSQTMTVMDFLNCNPAPTSGCGTVRAVLPITPSGQFSVDIHPLLNLAVIADSIHGQVFLLPLPR